MRVVILGCSAGNSGSRQYVSSYLINRTIAVDAGSVGFYGTAQDQESIRHVLLTHAHADHTASLPFFIENSWTPVPDCPTIYGSPETLDTVRRSIFNGEVWPDFVAMSEKMPPFLRLQPLKPEVPCHIEGLKVTPIPVTHSIPTVAYLVQEPAASVIFAADTTSTNRVWEAARQVPTLKAVFLEASFPNRMQAVADASLHLTPAMFSRELEKVPAGVRVIAVHLKVRYRDEIIRELQALGAPLLEIGECEREYVF